MQLGLTPPLGVNDVVLIRDGAYFTDSLKPFLYRVPIAPSGTLGMTSQALALVGYRRKDENIACKPIGNLAALCGRNVHVGALELVGT